MIEISAETAFVVLELIGEKKLSLSDSLPLKHPAPLASLATSMRISIGLLGHGGRNLEPHQWILPAAATQDFRAARCSEKGQAKSLFQSL